MPVDLASCISACEACTSGHAHAILPGVQQLLGVCNFEGTLTGDQQGGCGYQHRTRCHHHVTLIHECHVACMVYPASAHCLLRHMSCGCIVIHPTTPTNFRHVEAARYVSILKDVGNCNSQGLLYASLARCTNTGFPATPQSGREAPLALANTASLTSSYIHFTPIAMRLKKLMPAIH
jgi:hypothetical protein